MNEDTTNTQQTTATSPNNALGVPIAIIITGVLISVALFFGLNGANSNNTTTTPSNNQAPQGNNAQAPQQEQPTNVLVSVDDDPAIGDTNAPVVMVDFSDYECPFCKRYFTQSFAQIKSDYIDTGRLRYVYRDLPLSFHDPLATQEAIAANCAREQGDDETYFKYHDEIFNKTNSNGNGMPKSELYTIAKDLGLDANKFKQCLDSEKYKDEVQNDLADAQKYGATGTPTFFIGKNTDSGEFEGEMVVGAQPYAVIKAVIDKYLE